MERVPEVRREFWMNHEQTLLNKLQYTTSEKKSVAVQLVVGVLFGAAWPSLCDVLTRMWHWLIYYYCRLQERRIRGPETRPVPDERVPLLGDDRRSAHSLSEDRADAQEPRIRAESGPSRELVLHHSRASSPNGQTRPPSNSQANAPSNGQTNPPPPDQTGSYENAKRSSRSWPTTALSILLILAYLAFAVAGSLATTMPADSLGLSASKHCGSWSLDFKNAGNELKDNDDLLQAQKEMRAGQYGRDCYGHRSVTSPAQCAFFDNQTISYEVLKGQDCPFTDRDICAGGGYTAVRFSTGLVEASVLGINSPKAPKFNRTTVCVPLKLKDEFVKEIPPDTQHRDYRYEYYFGPVSGSEHSSNYTFRTFGDPFTWDIPAYSVSVYEATPYLEENYWSPINELDIRRWLDIKHPGQTYLTLMFISTCRIIYAGPSDDYIFHVADEYPHGNGKWWNKDPRARPLACIDWNEVCTAVGDCSPMNKDADYGSEYEFTRFALKKSTTFQAIRFRLGSALVAQESVGDFESLQLDDEQWIIESKALFDTSLARMQFDALDIAAGVGHEKAPSYSLETKENLCDMYRFQLPKGYANVNVVATLGFLSLAASLYVLALETTRGFSEDKKDKFIGNWMVFDTILWFIARVMYYILMGLRWVFHSIAELVKSSGT